MYRSAFARRARASVLLVLAVQASGLPVLAHAAPAQAPSRLVLLPLITGPGVADRSALRLSTMLREELEGRRDHLTLLPPVAPAAAAEQNRAADLLDAAKKDLAALGWEGAADKLKRAVDAAWAAPAQASIPLLTEAYLSWAVADFRRGDERGARTALNALIRLQPRFQLPPDGFPPVFARELEKARRGWEAAPKSSLAVEGPAGARAMVDGVEIGMVPEVQEGLAPGRHLVTVETTDGVRSSAAVEVAGQAVKVVAPFASVAPSDSRGPVPLPVPQRGTLDARLGLELGSHLKSVQADAALVVVLRRGPGDSEFQVLPAVYSARRNAFALLSPLPVGTDLVTANVEVYKLGVEVQKQLTSFGPVIPLPHLLLPHTAVATVVPPSGSAAGASFGAGPGTAPAPSVARGPLALAQGVVSSEPESAPAQAAVVSLAPLKSKSQVVREEGGGIPWWLWVVGGVGLAAAAGGTYYGVSQATRPVTGTVTARW